jgi:lipid A 3-O-deacylase
MTVPRRHACTPSHRRARSALRLLGLAALLLAAARAPAEDPGARRDRAGDGGRLSLLEENDAFAFPPTDRWYTQGFEARWLSAASSIASAAGAAGAPQRRFEAFLGQQLFTPVNLSRYPPDPADRPYAGWLYLGAGLLADHGGRGLDHYELELGVVGPAALGKQTQSAFHGLSGQVNPRAWDHQLRNEPGAVLSYERKWRVTLGAAGALGLELIPELGASVGNVYDYAEASVLLRFGRNLGADYGTLRMRPALSGSAWFDPAAIRGSTGWSIFVGAQGRAVARDLFLDGNSWRASARVERKPAVADLTAGASFSWAARWRLDAGWIWRSKEFTTQPSSERFGSIDLSFGF